MRMIGYAQVSTAEQHLNLQLAALQAAGCSHIHADHSISGTRFERLALAAALDGLRPGSMLVVAARALSNRPHPTIGDLGARQIELRSLSAAIGTASSGGWLLFRLLAAMAEFERSLISERTKGHGCGSCPWSSVWSTTSDDADAAPECEDRH